MPQDDRDRGPEAFGDRDLPGAGARPAAAAIVAGELMAAHRGGNGTNVLNAAQATVGSVTISEVPPERVDLGDLGIQTAEARGTIRRDHRRRGVVGLAQDPVGGPADGRLQVGLAKTGRRARIVTTVTKGQAAARAGLMATVIARNDRVVVGARRDGLGRRRGRIQTSGTRMAQVDDKIVARQIHATTDRLDRMALPGGNRAVRAGLTIIRTDADRSTAIGAAAGPMTQVRGGGTKVVTSALVVERNGRPIVVEMDLWAIHDGAGHDTQISASTVRVSEAVMR